MYLRIGSKEVDVDDKHVQAMIHSALLCAAGFIAVVSIFYVHAVTSTPLYWLLYAPASAGGVVAAIPHGFGRPDFVVKGVTIGVALYGWYSLLTLLASLKLKLSWRTRCICWTGIVLTWALPWIFYLVLRLS